MLLPWSKRRREPRRDPEELAVWMDPVELSQMLAVVHAVAPRHFLEWGSGGSTRALLERCPFIERYVAIEHNEAWGRKVRATISDPRLELRLVPPDRPFELASPTQDEIHAWEASAEHDESIFETYVHAAGSSGVVYDAILVDGRARRYCIRYGFELLRPGGVMLLHDAQREAYHDALAAVGKPVFLEPWQQGQIALVRKSGL
jgi:predicted O-methyltransferase YrrM